MPSQEPKDVMLRFSDIFGVKPRVIERYGAFDVSLVADLPLFIDPFLLFNSRKRIYRQLHGDIIRYLQFLRDKSSNQALDSGLIRAWYRFPEVRQNWLGFTQSGNRGSGLGTNFARALHLNLFRLFPDFGEEHITQGSHLEKLCLIENGVGRDNISDFTVNLVKGFLLEYTERFAQKHLDKSQCGSSSVPRVTFSYSTESWQPKKFYLPKHESDFVILTPKDMLAKDETWINKKDLISDFESIPDSIPDVALRAQINNYFRSVLPKKAKEKEQHEAAVRTILRFPQIIDYYIRNKESDGDQAVSLSASNVRFSEELYLRQFGRLASLLAQKTDFYYVPGNTHKEAMERISFMKDVIENKGGHELFYVGGKHITREQDIHIMYRLTWFATPSDVSREVNDGRGPADFKISRGAKDKSIVEFKLASNSKLKQNLQHQTEIYAKASDARDKIKVIVFFTRKEQERATKILKELGLYGRPDVVMIDARKDNKPSGSKAA